MNRVDTAVLVLRLLVAGTLLMHTYNHVFGGGKLPGAARWFESMGLRNGMMQARMSVLSELLAAGGLTLGFLTPLAAAAAVGTMTVAGVAAHRPNGYFVFRDGYEYVLFIATTAVCIATIGPGRASLDHAGDIVISGWAGAAIAAGAGLGGAGLLLATMWRPPAKADKTEA